MPDDDVDLAPELRRWLDEQHARLDDTDHYTLLGVPRDADRKAIKNAYFAHAARLHPDRWFGKRLGPWKAKLDAVFARMTVAHDTLTNAARRAEYDAYLRQHAEIQAFERALELDVEVPPLPAEERTASSHTDHAARTASDPTRTPQAPSPAELERARREALARRLMAGSSRRMPAVAPPRTASIAPPPSPVPNTPRPGTASIAPPRATTSTAPPQGPSSIVPPPRDAARAQAVETLVSAARTAAASGDYATASNKMRLAARVDPTLAAEADQLTRRAHAAMADTYVAQARFEESEERWVAAALSWAKAFEGRPNEATLAARAANALRKAGGDLRRAVRLAETAVRLAPNDVGCRLVLVEVYHAAGLPRRAAGELDNARKLAPNDPRVRELANKIG